ncbi:MAG: hypothetical protein ACOX9C_10085 [Kiritimatiellia bacterium]|jgi:hypothetical protein
MSKQFSQSPERCLANLLCFQVFMPVAGHGRPGAGVRDEHGVLRFPRGSFSAGASSALRISFCQLPWAGSESLPKKQAFIRLRTPFKKNFCKGNTFLLHSFGECFTLSSLVTQASKPSVRESAMGTLLKVLTVFIFLLSILALVMGLANFQKRELLIGRTHALEEKIIQLSKTLEEKDPAFDGVANHPERDTDVVSDRPIDVPSKSDFWSDYNDALEVLGTPTMRIDDPASRALLGKYFKLDSEGKIVKIGNRPVTTGEGTMDEILSRVLDRAQAQLKTLNNTRTQLTVVRQELETAIELLNDEKKAHRLSKRTITSLEQKVAELESEIDRQKANIARLEREKDELRDQIVERDNKINKLDEQIKSQDNRINILEEIIRKTEISSGGGATALQKRDDDITLTAGVKGTVIKVDRELAFVIVKLTPETVAEITAGGFAPVEMMVHRKTDDGDKIVTRLRIANPPNKDNLVIADNLFGWEQLPVEAGDTVIY